MVYDIMMSTDEYDRVQVQLLSKAACAWARANMHIAEIAKVNETTFLVDERDFEMIVYPFIKARLSIALNGKQIFVKSDGRVTYFPDETELDGWKDKIQRLQTAHIV